MIMIISMKKGITSERISTRCLVLAGIAFVLVVIFYFYTYPVRPALRPYKPHLLCERVMTNLTNGKWVHWSKFITDPHSEEYKRLSLEEREFDNRMNEFRIQRGIHTKLWRDDTKCGLKNKQTKPKGNAWGGSVGSWCDAKSDRPCCSDEDDGTCGMECDCQKCIDMREILHAEYARWVPSDERCQWRNYTATEACDVIGRFFEVHVIGDSFVRKMARVMISMLRNDRNQAVVYKKYDEKLKKKCVGDDQLYWTECALGVGTYKQLLVDERPLCGMDLSRFVLHGNYAFDAGDKTLSLVKAMAGKPGGLIILGVGGHMNCRANATFERVVRPSVNYLNTFYEHAPPSTRKWPLIIYMFPDTPDVLKSPDYRAANGKVPCYKFSDAMTKYLTDAGVPYLDFRRITSNVHSYDGTHHGIGVNVQKLQVLFNYLDSFDLHLIR